MYLNSGWLVSPSTLCYEGAVPGSALMLSWGKASINEGAERLPLPFLLLGGLGHHYVESRNLFPELLDVRDEFLRLRGELIRLFRLGVAGLFDRDRPGRSSASRSSRRARRCVP